MSFLNNGSPFIRVKIFSYIHHHSFPFHKNIFCYHNVKYFYWSKICYFSYAREWHEKLRELKESRAGLSLTVKSGPRSPTRDALLSTAAAQSSKPEITIKPAFKLMRSPPHGGKDAHTTPLKVDPSGALNLSTGSPSPELSSPTSATSPDTSTRISPAPARSPQGYRPPSYNSVELCVVCGDRASGK